MKQYKCLTCVLSVAILVLAGSCKLGKDYVRPELSLPESLDGSVNDSVTVAQLSWEKLYADTLLQELIARSLVYNKDMLMAAARIKELAALKRVKVAEMYPNFGAYVYGEKEGENYGGNNYNPDNEFELKVVASWELDLWGKLRWARDKSLAELMASVENRRSLQISLIAQVAEAYFDLVALDNELAIVRQTVEARKESAHLVKLRYDGGLISEIPYRLAQVELAKTLAMIPELERKVTLKENELAFLTGEYPYSIRRVARPTDIILPDTLPVGLPSGLLERRPDVRMAEQELMAANANVGIAFTSLFPSISLTAGFGAESDELVDLLRSPHHLLGVKLLEPLFAMGKNRATLKARKAAFERAVYGYEKAVLAAFNDAYNAIVEYNKVKEIYNAQRRLEESAKTTLELAQLQYVNGAIGYMDLLDAQRSYFDAQLGLSNAVRNKQTAVVNLYKALGGGW